MPCLLKKSAGESMLAGGLMRRSKSTIAVVSANCRSARDAARKILALDRCCTVAKTIGTVVVAAFAASAKAVLPTGLPADEEGPPPEAATCQFEPRPTGRRGHAADAPPSSAMNARRLMFALIRAPG